MKKLFTFFGICLMVSTISAQNFTKFDAVDNKGVKALNGIAFRSTEMTILVPENFDLSNVTLDCAVGASDEIVNAIPTDFTSPQTIITKTMATGATKTWKVIFTKLEPAALPLTVLFSTSDRWTTPHGTGWAGAGIDPGQTQIVRYGNSTVTFAVAFSDTPGKISFDLNVVGGALAGNGQFDVYSSADGAVWTNVMSFNATNPIPGPPATTYDFIPSSDVRYVKWSYTLRDGQNLNLNNINVEKGTSTIIEESISYSNIYANGNELVIADSEINKVEVYTIAGTQALVANNPSGSIDLSGLAKGIYVAKATADSKTKTIKFVIK